MIEFNNRVDYNINYIRNTIIGLSKRHKPVIVSGVYIHNPTLSYSTFLNIKPFKTVKGKRVVTKTICDHISIWNEFLHPYFEFSEKHNRKTFYLICSAYTYENNDGVLRGGLRPTEELQIQPVLENDELLKQIPQDKYIDFFDFAEGKYAWIYGHPNFINGKLVKKEKKKRLKKPIIQKQESVKQINVLANGIVIPECPLHVDKYSTKYKKAFQTLDNDWVPKF